MVNNQINGVIDSEQFGTKDKYIKAFTNLQNERNGMGIITNHRALLKAHLCSPNYTSTWEQLAKDAKCYKAGHTVNLQYGKLAHRIAKELGITEPPKGFWLYVLADWARTEDPSGKSHTTFVLRRPVIDALIKLDYLDGIEID